MSSTQGSPAPPSAQGSPLPEEFRGELTPAPLDLDRNHDSQPDAAAAAVTIGGMPVYFADERTATMMEYLASFNSSGDRAWVAHIAEVCSEILGDHPTATRPAPVDRHRDPLVLRKRKHIDRIFNGRRDASEEDCERAIKSFKSLWGKPPVPIGKLALWRLARHLRLARRNSLRVPARYHKTFILTIFENEANGQFIGLDEPEDDIIRKMEEVYREVKDIVDRPIEI